MIHWYKTSISSWKNKLKVSSCNERVSDNAGVEHIELGLEQTNDTACRIVQGYMTCLITRTASSTWGFITASFCQNNLTQYQIDWKVVSTNGEGFLSYHPPATDRYFFTVNLVMGILTFLLVIFWLVYPNTIKLNSTIFLTYKISLWFSMAAFWACVGSNGVLNSTGKRNYSHIVASLLSFVSLALLAHITVIVAYAGSLVTVQISRCKTALSYLITFLYFALNFGMIIYELITWDARTRVYFMDMDSSYVWVVCGVHIMLWVNNSFATALNIISPSVGDRSFYKLFYIFFSIIILSVPLAVIFCNVNLPDTRQHLFILSWCSSIHVVCYLFFFIFIKDNHTLSSILTWLKTSFRKICCCCCGVHSNKNVADRKVPCCLKCCPCIPVYCPCLMCLPCCKANSEDMYGSEGNIKEDLVDILKKHKKRKESNIDINLVDLDCSDDKDNVIIQNTTCLREPSNDLIESSNDLIKPSNDLIKPSNNLLKASIDSSSDNKTKSVSITTAEIQNSNVKVIPWLDQTYPTYKGLSDHGYNFKDQPSLLHVNKIQPTSDTLSSPHGSKKSLNVKKKPPLYRFHCENFGVGRGEQGRPKAEFVVRSLDGSESIVSREKDDKDFFHKDLDKKFEGPRWSNRGWSHIREGLVLGESDRIQGASRDDLEQQSNEEPQFNTNQYNTDKIRNEKVTKVTMRYRRNTLKQKLSNVPSKVLLERVKLAHENSPSQISPINVRVLRSTPRPGPPARSNSKIWKMLSEKYSGGAFGTKNDKLRMRFKVLNKGAKDRWR